MRRNFGLCCLLAALTLMSVSAEEAEFNIEVLHMPEECPRKSQSGDLLTMHYTGTLAADGKQFDSSRDRKEPFKFQIGVGQVIQGWEKGAIDMCINERRKLTVPASMGYGDKGAGDAIPPHATLHFDIELLNVEDGPKQENVFKKIDSDGDEQLSMDEVAGFLKQQMEEHAKTAPEGHKPDPNDHNKMVEEIFSHEDKDKDGFISYEEFSGPKHDEL